QRRTALPQLAAEPAAQLVPVVAIAVDGHHEMPVSLLRSENAGHDVELAQRNLVPTIDRAAVDFLGDAELAGVRFCRQPRQEHEVVIALPQHGGLGSPVGEAVGAELGDQQCRQPGGAAQQPGGRATLGADVCDAPCRAGRAARTGAWHLASYIDRQPPASGRMATVAPALIAGARGARTTRQSAFAMSESIELSCLSNGVATRR